jgi:Zn-finger nucleic acid-binding protein
MNCPKCKIPMLVVEYDRIELDFCVRCEGTWFDRGELALLFADSETKSYGLQPEQIAALPDAQTDEERRKCPACGKKMRKVLLGPEHRVLIDACPQGDGLWFDDSEVGQLAREIRETGAGLSGRALAFMGRMFQEQEGPEPAEGETE